MAPVLLFLIFVCGATLTWQWLTCQNDYNLFQDLFNNARREESFLSLLEKQVACESDEDKEEHVNWVCVAAVFYQFPAFLN
jgi:hypothetical protein